MVSTPGDRGRVPADALGAVEPIPVTRRADQVVTRIRDLIAEEALQRGDRLPPERTLAQRFGTSRAIVSQALRTLVLMGMIEIRPGSGAYVTRNPAAMVASSVDLLVRTHEGRVEDIAELRYWLESVGAQRALERRSADDLLVMEEALGRMETSRRELSTWVNADSDFHAAVVQAAGNPYLVPLYESVHAAVTSVAYDVWVAEDRIPRWFSREFDQQIELHRALFDAVRDEDAAGLLAVLERHHRALIDHLQHRRD